MKIIIHLCHKYKDILENPNYYKKKNKRITIIPEIYKKC